MSQLSRLGTGVVSPHDRKEPREGRMMTLFPGWKRSKKAARKAHRLEAVFNSLPDEYARQRLDIGATLQRAVQYAVGADVEGDIVEFGTATGFTASVFARTLQEVRRGDGRRLWLFDSFSGLPEASAEADAQSPHVSSGLWSMGACRGLTAAELRKQVSRFLDNERIVVSEGWFADTVPRIPEAAKFAIVHVDGDLYQSAMDCLTPLLRRRQISAGALVIFDDWNCNQASDRFGERRAWKELSGQFNLDCEEFGHWSWAGKSFIVHTYS